MVEWNRDCPHCGAFRGSIELLAEVPASAFCGVNSTYRDDWAEILGIARDARFPLCRCRSCRFVFAGWNPPSDFLETVYCRVIDPASGSSESTRPSWLARQSRIAAQVLEEVELRWGPRKGLRALDVGCSYGNQLRILQIAGFEAMGVETSASAQEHLSRVGVPWASSLEEAVAGGGFQVALLNEVLEHVADFRGLLRQVFDCLLPGGVAWFSVPDFSTWRLEGSLRDLAAGRAVTRELNLWEHLNYFTPRDLRAVVMEAGFRLLEGQYVVELGSRAGPGWKQPKIAARLARTSLRWFLKGPPRRTELLAERP